DPAWHVGREKVSALCCPRRQADAHHPAARLPWSCRHRLPEKPRPAGAGIDTGGAAGDSTQRHGAAGRYRCGTARAPAARCAAGGDHGGRYPELRPWPDVAVYLFPGRQRHDLYRRLLGHLAPGIGFDIGLALVEEAGMNILITGAGGYIGRQLGERLARTHNVIGVDVRAAADLPFALHVMDIRDAAIGDLMKQHGITHVVHLAAVLEDSGDRARDYDIDVNGTRNVLEGCVAAGVQHITVTSSGAAYGYHADNPEWLRETDALRGNPEFAYADHKRQVEAML